MCEPAIDFTGVRVAELLVAEERFDLDLIELETGPLSDNVIPSVSGVVTEELDVRVNEVDAVGDLEDGDEGGDLEDRDDEIEDEVDASYAASIIHSIPLRIGEWFGRGERSWNNHRRLPQPLA